MPAPKKPATPKKPAAKKVTKKTSDPSLKISEQEKNKFPYELFPVKVMHMDGKDKKDLKTCYFTNEVYAKKYIDKSNFKKNEYLFFVKGK